LAAPHLDDNIGGSGIYEDDGDQIYDDGDRIYV
jgi:hypothetical protein